MKHNYTLLLFILFFSLGYSQMKVTGIVVDENNKPIENIYVIIKNSDKVSIEGDLTNIEGVFTLNTTIKNVKLQIVQFNEIYYEKDLELNANIDLGKIIIDNSKVLQEIVVIGKKTNIKKELGKFVVDNISTSQFSKGKSSYEVLNYVPILNSSEKGISIFNKGEATIFINGKPVGENDIALNMIKSIPASNIKKVEIIANPDSKYEANNKNGIINIILKNNENEGVKGSISASTNQSYYNSQYGSGFLSYSKKKVNITSGVNIDNTKNFSRFSYLYNNIPANQQTQIQSNTIDKSKNYSYFINSDFKINEKNNIGLQLGYRLNDKKSNTEANNIFKNIDSENINSTSLNNITKQSPNNNSFRANLNYTHQLDSLGSNIYIDNTQVIRNNNFDNNFDFINSNSPNEKFKQIQDEKFNVNASKIDITKIINEDNKLFFGGNFIYSDIKNDFFHGNFEGLGYVSDPLQTNNYTYTDKTLAGYINYEKIFNEKWEGKIGFRLENFEGKGRTITNDDITKIKNTYLFPSFSLLFMPNENNEISLDASSYILRPYYTQLNPFVRYNSSNSYTINNPNLLPTLSYELTLGYSFKNRYFLNVSYIYDKNLFNDFDIVLPSNLIQRTTANYGNGNDINLNFTYTNNFFNKNLNFTAIFNYKYQDSYGFYNDFDMSFQNNSYSFRLKNQINLSKEKDFNMSLIYGYNSSINAVFGNLNNLHSLVLDFTKTYKNFNFSLSAYDLLRPNLNITENKATYSFLKNIEYFRNIKFSLRYNFGNKKIKKIEDKSSEINNRLL